MKHCASAVTAKSPHHADNEDSHYACDDFLVVADGMGGECNGALASKMAVKAVVKVLKDGLRGASTDSYVKALSAKAVAEADRAITDYIQAHPQADGMGTTLLIAVRLGDRLAITWCGDSRCYAYNGAQLRSVTKDHSYVQQLVDQGEITPEEAYSHPDNNLITRYVGGGEDLCVPDHCVCDMADGDTIILCSDGLSGYCRPQEIADLISATAPTKRLPRQLLDLAIAHGSDDDITILTLTPSRSWLKTLLGK